MAGIGRECGISIRRPCWSFRIRNPISRRALWERGGVLTSPLRMTSDLSASASPRAGQIMPAEACPGQARPGISRSHAPS
jgi:hypothetical protein